MFPIVNVRTGTATPLPRRIRDLGSAEQFAVAPDGRRVAFASDKGIYVATLDGRRLRLVVAGHWLEAPSWSPDGDSLVYSSGYEGFVVDVATGASSLVIAADGQLWHPNFSPDGSAILYTRLGGARLALWTVPAVRGTGEGTVLVRRAAFGSYSSNGSIAFRKTAFRGSDPTQMTKGVVLVADAATGAPRGMYVPGPGGSMSQIDADHLWPAWSLDGRMIAAEALYGRGVGVIDTRTGWKRFLGEGARPAWIDDHTLILEGYQPPDS